MPAAGRLDRRVTIARKTEAQDETGQPIETWSLWKKAWMGKRDVRAEERFRTDQELATETTVWMSHYIDGLGEQDRLIVEGKTYDIIGIAELGRRSGYEITARANLGLPELVLVAPIIDNFYASTQRGTLAITGYEPTIPDFLAETDALISAMSVAPSIDRVFLIDATIQSLQNAGIWTKLDALWIIAAHDSQAANLNWKAPASNTLSVANGAPIFTVDLQYAFDGIADQITTNFNPTTAGGGFAQNSCHMAVWGLHNSNSSNTYAGFFDGVDGITLRPRGSNNEVLYRVNQAALRTSSAGVNTNAIGFFAINRSASNAIQAYFDGAAKDSSNTVSTAMNNAALLLGGTAAGTFVLSKMAAACVGGSLTATEHANLYAALNNYMAGVGVISPVAVSRTNIDTTIGEGDPLAATDITGNVLQDLLFVQEDGKHYWYEHTVAGSFTRHTIRGTAITNAKFEGAVWADFDGDGEYEAYTADQSDNKIWVHVQDIPGTPTGTWTGGIIKTGATNVQNLLVVDLDGTKTLLYAWEGSGTGSGGITALTYDGSGDLTDSANWTATTLISHEGAWWMDPAGLVSFGGGTILFFGARSHLNPNADPGAFYITKPVGSPFQAWAETIVHSSASDWLHVASGNFFGNAVVTDLAIHNSSGQVKLFDSSNAWAAVTLQTTAAIGRYNLRNIGRTVNSRNTLISLGESKGGEWRWNGTAWIMVEWQITLQKTDGSMPVFDVNGDATNDLLFVDSFAHIVSWVSGASM